MEYLILTIVAFVVGFKVSEFLHVLSFKKVLEDLGVTNQQLRDLARKNGMGNLVEEAPKDSITGEITVTPIEIKLEQHQGQIYAYRLDNDQFLGQGTDRDALLESLKANLTNVRLIVSEEHGASLIKNPEKA